MSYRTRLFAVAGTLALALFAFLIWPHLEERIDFGPELVRAWVAIEPAESGEAIVGPVTLSEGERFTLHAVLEARGRTGETVYLTEAPTLRIGGERVPSEAVRRWSGQPSKVLWFTVEGAAPVFVVAEGRSLDQFVYQEFLRPEWGTAWSVPGSLDPAHDEPLEPRSRLDPEPFGSQRFHVRIELYASETALVPERRFASWKASDLEEHREEFPSVTVEAKGGAAQASTFFGLSEIVLPDDADPEMFARVADWTRERIAYSRLTLLRDLMVERGNPEWSLVDSSAGVPWGDRIQPGDLLRVGSRFVVALRDAGAPGVLDAEDLCLDFHPGTAVVKLGDVFEGNGELSWAPAIRDIPR